MVLLLSAVGLPAGAQVPPSLHACASIPSNSERLACFDREDARLSGSSSKPAAPLPPANNAPPAAARTLAAAPAAPAAAAPPPVSAPPAPPPSAAPAAALLPPEQTFGLNRDQLVKAEAHQQGLAPPPKLKNLSAQVASASQNSAGHWVMTLDNGQVWRQTQDQRDFSVSAGETVKISTGAMGSFWLQTNRHNWAKVERVQ